MRPFFLGLVVAAICGAERFDLAPFAHPCCSADEYRLQTTFDYALPRGVVRAADGRWIYGLQWAEERDIEQVRVRFRGQANARAAAVEYWFLTWPYDPPKMPTIEDPVDDPWQGRWRRGRTRAPTTFRACPTEGRSKCAWSFRPNRGPTSRRLPCSANRRSRQ